MISNELVKPSQSQISASNHKHSFSNLNGTHDLISSGFLPLHEEDEPLSDV